MLPWEYETSTSYGGLNSNEDYYPLMLLYHSSTGKQLGIESFMLMVLQNNYNIR